MNNNPVWREAKDDMGRPVWLNMSLARCIRRDPRGRSTVVIFDNGHAVTVETPVNDLIADGTATAPARRPRDF